MMRARDMARAGAAAAAVVIALLAQGCGESAPPAAATPRPVKVARAGAAAAAPGETFVATVRAHRRAELAFEEPGRVAAVLVDIGDHVRAGQVLARLDVQPVQWRLDKARADRDAAAAQLKERATQLRLQEPLAREQIISAPALESVRAQHAVAAAQLQSAEAALAAAQRELALAQITAPFDGEVVSRAVQPHAQVGAAQAILQLEAPGALEVVAMLPADVAARLAPGQAALARLSSADGAPGTASLVLERVSPREESGSLAQAVFRVEGAPAAVRNGSVVQVELQRAGAPVIAVASSALLPAPEAGAGSVFVLDEPRGRVERRTVRVGAQALPDGRLPVLAGLGANDLVVVAGAAFLADGEPAVRLPAASLVAEGAR